MIVTRFEAPHPLVVLRLDGTEVGELPVRGATCPRIRR